jgi:hypothetical protein
MAMLYEFRRYIVIGSVPFQKTFISRKEILILNKRNIGMSFDFE